MILGRPKIIDKIKWRDNSSWSYDSDFEALLLCNDNQWDHSQQLLAEALNLESNNCVKFHILKEWQPLNPTKSTARPLSANDIEWYCILGLRPTSPKTRTQTRLGEESDGLVIVFATVCHSMPQTTTLLLSAQLSWSTWNTCNYVSVCKQIVSQHYHISDNGSQLTTGDH